MLSKEEIEKAKEKTKKWIYNMRTGRRVNIIHKGDKDFCNDLETLLQYIDQLEQENKVLKHTNKTYKGLLNKQNKIIDEMAEHIVSSAIVDDTVCSRIFCEVQEDCSHKKMLNCTKQYFEKK